MGDEEVEIFEEEDFRFATSDPEESSRPMHGPFLPGMYRTREGYDFTLLHGEFSDRRIAFREKLNLLARIYHNTFINQGPDWERDLTNLEGDVGKLVVEFDPSGRTA